MENFQNYQVGTWLSNGLIVRAKEKAEQAFSVVKDKIPAVLTSVAAIGAATVFLAIPQSNFTVSTNSKNIEKSEVHAVVKAEGLAHATNERNQAGSTEQIENLQKRMEDFRKRIAKGQLGISAENLRLARKARESSLARASEDSFAWAEKLIKSQRNS